MVLILHPSSSPLPVPTRVFASKRPGRWVMEGSIVWCWKETGEGPGLLVVPALPLEGERELYQIPKAFPAVGKVVVKRNGLWREKNPANGVRWDTCSFFPPSPSFLLNAFFSERSICFLFLFNFLIYLLIYSAWVVMLLKTLIKENG